VRADITPADVYLNAGDALARQWQYRDALALYSAAQRVGEGPQKLRAGLGIATSAVRLADFDLAYAKASQLRREYPGDLQVLGVYGQAAWSNGLFSDAEDAFRDVLAQHVEDVESRLGMGWRSLRRPRARRMPTMSPATSTGARARSTGRLPA
jgi:Flp pilus assembly protein TadD